MKSLVLVWISIVSICSFTACSKRLDEDVEFSKHQIQGWLVSVDEYLLPNQYYPDGRRTRMFNEPKYDSEGRVESAFCNFVGIPANHHYTYDGSRIVLKKNCIDRETDSAYVYSLVDDRIVSCTICDYNSLEESDHRYEYHYDNHNHLIRIDEVGCKVYRVFTLTWKGGNLIDITESMFEDSSVVFTSSCRFQYVKHKKYRNAFVPIHFQHYLISLYGVDEVLSSQGYFGKMVSEDIPVCEASPVNYVYRMELDSKGYINKIYHLKSDSNDSVIREYNLIWR